MLKRRFLFHINRFSGTELCFRWVLFRENVLDGAEWDVVWGWLARRRTMMGWVTPSVVAAVRGGR